MRPIWETPRLVAREMTLGDLDFVAAMLADPEVMRYYPRCYSRVEAEAWVVRQQSSYRAFGHGRWLILDRSDGRPVGQVGLLSQLVEGIEQPEIAYMIDRPWWRRGFATEAASATRDHAFEVLGRTRVISLIRPENVPSRGVASKIGMRPGRMIVHADLDHIVYEMERGDTDRAVS